jgi:hypothetical protein
MHRLRDLPRSLSGAHKRRARDAAPPPSPIFHAMNSSDSVPPPPGDAPLKLPDLTNASLDAAQVEQLLRDIELCAQITEIIPKLAARGHVPEAPNISLAQARELLASRAIRGLQIRYRYENADWWDTLMLTGEQFRLVRIRHDFSSAPGPDAS